MRALFHKSKTAYIASQAGIFAIGVVAASYWMESPIKGFLVWSLIYIPLEVAQWRVEIWAEKRRKKKLK